jgi:hypothetical protein
MELYKEVYSENERRYNIRPHVSVSHRSTKSYVIYSIGLLMLCSGTLDLTFSAGVLLPGLCCIPQSGEKLEISFYNTNKSITVVMLHSMFLELRWHCR